MTMPNERTRAVMQTRELLQELALAGPKAGIPESLRREARRLLRHYPGSADMNLAHQALPQWFGEVPVRPVGTPRTGHLPESTDSRGSRVGIVQSLDLKTGRCHLRDGLTEELRLFIAKSEAARSVLAEISEGQCVDYQVDRRGRVVGVGASNAEEQASTLEALDALVGRLIAVDPDIMGGVPCFAGSRLPVSTLLGSLESGDSLESLRDSWPFLTEGHIRAARRFAESSRLDTGRGSWT